MESTDTPAPGQSRRSQILLGIVIALLFAAFVYWANRNPPLDTKPGPGYYTGAFRSKGDPNRCFDASGKELPCPGPAPSTAPNSNQRTGTRLDF